MEAREVSRRIILAGKSQKEFAKALIDNLELGHSLTIEPPRRSLPQNKLLWSMLADISRAEPMGRKLTPDEWKAVFMAACGWEVQFLPGLDGRPFPAGFRSSKMTVKQMADLLTFIMAWGNENGIRWSEPQ